MQPVSHLISGMFCRQGHGGIEEVGERHAKVVQHKLDLLPERQNDW